MDWAQILVLFGSILGVVVPLHIQNLSRLDAIHQEMKDFHGRLCAIEERRKKGD